MYNAFASSQEAGSKGSTRLHMDMADALNVMMYATACEDGTDGYAVWDIFRAEDSEHIRKFLRWKYGYQKAEAKTPVAEARGEGAAPEDVEDGSDSGSGSSKKKPKTKPTVKKGKTKAGPKVAATPVQIIGYDPIHGQQFYLDVALRKELYDTYGVKSLRVYQRPGDGVFIPAGCAHQVANMADCMKIAIDFVSPENIDRCEQLTKEFREQNQAKAWKEDVLQLRTMMWFAWQSCAANEKALKGDADNSSATAAP
jgi:lysine-specific demethylase 3